MIENIKAVNNPLTVIAIFAGIAEVAATVSLGLLTPELQFWFMWFVIGFPTLLVILFFATLIWRPKVLYSPSDFKNEDNFLRALGLLDANIEAIEAVVKEIDSAETPDNPALVEIAEKVKSSQLLLDELQQEVISRKAQTQEYTFRFRTAAKGIADKLQNKIFELSIPAESVVVNPTSEGYDVILVTLKRLSAEGRFKLREELKGVADRESERKVL